MKQFMVFSIHSTLIETNNKLRINVITVTAVAIDGSTVKWISDKKSLPQIGYEFTLQLPIKE